MVEDGQKILKLARGDVIGQKYEIEELLGGGLLGTTYLAKQLSTGKHLVLKFFHQRLVRNPKDRERLEQAFRKARAIKHVMQLLARVGMLFTDLGCRMRLH